MAATQAWKIAIALQAKGNAALQIRRLGAAAVQTEKSLSGLRKTLTLVNQRMQSMTGASSATARIRQFGTSMTGATQTTRVLSRAIAQTSQNLRGMGTAATLAANNVASALNRANGPIRRRGGGAMADGGLLAVAEGGALAGGALLSGARGAANLETTLVALRNATGASDAQLSMLRAVAFDISAATAQSVTDSAHVMAVMARASAGVFTPEQLAKVAMPAAKFADVQFLSRGIPFQEGASWAIQLAHLFRQYDPKGVNTMFDRMTRLSEMMPHNLGTALRQMTYYMPTFKALHIDDDSSIATMAMLDRFGFGTGKGGTNVANLVNEALGPLQLTTHAQVKKNDLLQKMGILDKSGRSMFFDRKAQRFDFIAFMRQLSLYAKGKSADDVHKQYLSVFGKQGGRIADLATDPKFLDQLQKIIVFLNRKDLSMDDQQARYMRTVNGQFQLWRTNFASLLTDIMWPWLDDMRGTFSWLAAKTHDLQKFLHEHHTLEKTVAVGLTGAAIVGGISAAMVGAAMLGSIGLSPMIGIAALGTAALETALFLTGPVGLTIAVGALIAALTLHVLKFPPINSKLGEFLASTGKLNNGFGDLARGIQHLLEYLHLFPSGKKLTPDQLRDQLRGKKLGVGPAPKGQDFWKYITPKTLIENWQNFWRRQDGSGHIQTDAERARLQRQYDLQTHQMHLNPHAPLPKSPAGRRNQISALYGSPNVTVKVDYKPSALSRADHAREMNQLATIVAERVAGIFAAHGRTPHAGTIPAMLGGSHYEIEANPV